MRIGILGGTFNPVHLGHLMIAQMVLETFDLDKVVFIPSSLPPHKNGRDVIPADHRIAMVQLAVKDNALFAVSDYEMKRGGKSYSIDTVIYLRECYPLRTKFFFIIGNDHLTKLHTWRRIEEIVKIVSFVAVYRPGFEAVSSRIKTKSIVIPGVMASSSDIRRRIAAGKTVRYLVPDRVLGYIEKHKLYDPIYERGVLYGQ